MYHLEEKMNESFDISPVNTVLNLCKSIGIDYDDKGTSKGV
jgi:hypothetical protein